MAWIRFAAVGSMPLVISSPKSAPRNADLVDERGRGRVEQRARDTSARRESGSGGSGSWRRRPRSRCRPPRTRSPPSTAPSRSPIPRKSSRLRLRVDREDPDGQDEPDPVPGQPPPHARPLAGAGRLVVLGGPEALGVEAEHRHQQRSPGRPRIRRAVRPDERLRRRPRRTRGLSSRPFGASPGRPPAGSPPTRPASCAACPPSASRGACACA